MTYQTRVIGAFSIMAALLLIVGFFQSWSLVLAILNLCLISSIMIGPMFMRRSGGILSIPGALPLVNLSNASLILSDVIHS